MKKYLSIMLLVIAAVFVSCGDDKDEPKQPEIQTMSTAFLKGKAFQNVEDQTEYIIFTKSQKCVDFYVKENDKRLWLYYEWDFEVKTEDSNTYLCRSRLSSEGKLLTPKNRIWLDWNDRWQNYTYQNIVIEYDHGDYIGKEERTYKQVGSADDVLAKFASYTKD